MATFVHLAPTSSIAHIRRSGISKPRKSSPIFPGGVFAVPVTPNFFITHQWLREMRRRGVRMTAVYFRIADGERVWVGPYGADHRWMTATQSVAAFMSPQDRRGWEVVIPRKISTREIHRVRELPQVVGWRYFPGSHGRRPCPCEYCTRGEYNAASIRRRLGPGGSKTDGRAV